MQVPYEKMQFGIARCGYVLEKALPEKSALVFFNASDRIQEQRDEKSRTSDIYTLLESSKDVQDRSSIVVYCESNAYHSDALDAFEQRVKRAAQRAHVGSATRGWFEIHCSDYILTLGSFSSLGDIVFKMDHLSREQKEYACHVLQISHPAFLSVLGV